MKGFNCVGGLLIDSIGQGYPAWSQCLFDDGVDSFTQLLQFGGRNHVADNDKPDLHALLFLLFYFNGHNSPIMFGAARTWPKLRFFNQIKQSPLVFFDALSMWGYLIAA